MNPETINYPQTPEEEVYCEHGNHIWFGHECGICDSGYENEV